ncbi:hypothetical protein [Rhizobium tumorigenes]|uniref:hypothetical protein n=1 Tax=Rhizobium tumorigenes TaxID=2041385 RepID=UPI00241DA42A|nr:hypothetical protein [Rhizobium tumorigenes]WFS02224.1 hypothetical protein PR016_06315 [Rhizobium tumorigenes]
MPALLANPWVLLGLVVAILGGAAGLYAKGHSDGTASGEAAQKTAIFEQLKERNITDADVQKMPGADLCRAIGGELRGDKCE